MKDEEEKNNSDINIEKTDDPQGEDDVVEFVGMAGEKLGPFKKGDVANLDRWIADILVLDKKAEEIEEE